MFWFFDACVNLIKRLQNKSCFIKFEEFPNTSQAVSCQAATLMKAYFNWKSQKIIV
jgi:hypothetical protein